MDHIAHQPGLDGQAFHLMASKSQRSGDVLNTFAKAAHAPHMAIRIDKRLTDALPKGVGSLQLQLPALKGVRRPFLADLGIPEEILGHLGFPLIRHPRRRAGGHRHRMPPLDNYAERSGTTGSANRPDLYKRGRRSGRDQRAHSGHHRRVSGSAVPRR